MNARTIALVLKSLSDVEMARLAEILSVKEPELLERAYNPIKKNLQVFDLNRFKKDVAALRPGLDWSSFSINLDYNFNIELRAYYKAKNVYVNKSKYSAYEAIREGEYSFEPVEGWTETNCSDSMNFSNLLKAEDYCTWETL